ncbi:hypothetical protein EYF80_028075 [Liparis tanakae]|uniref:Uncharacterized protein n=1 Tax=Liparis tanakae TaxID=230148 RepID=A0A4Z2H9J1_9TELE|nr:hypothetical protein EYF80_028075 [Liparis tanakae]
MKAHEPQGKDAAAQGPEGDTRVRRMLFEKQYAIITVQIDANACFGVAYVHLFSCALQNQSAYHRFAPTHCEEEEKKPCHCQAFIIIYWKCRGFMQIIEKY